MVSAATESSAPYLARFEADDTLARATSPSGYPVVAPAHLRLRSFEPADISRRVAIASGRHVADSTMDVPHPFAARFTQPWVESHAAAWHARHSLHWAVSVLADDQLVGYTGLHNIEIGNRPAQLSFWISSGMERRGYATEAAQAALAVAFATLEMNRVVAMHLARNLLAGRTLKQVGMQQEGLLRQRVGKWDQFEDVIICGILRSDWLESL